MQKRMFSFRRITLIAFMMLGIASLSVMVSCNKEQAKPELSEQQKFEEYVKQAKNFANVKWEPRTNASNKAPLSVSYTNPDNPFDYVGALHNQGLDYFIDNYQSYPALIKIKNGKKEFSLHEMWKIIGNFGRDNNIQGLRQITLNPHFRNAMNQEIINNFPNLATQLSPLAYNYLQNILNAMPSTTEAVPLSPVIGPCPVRVGMCRDGVAAIETQIQNDVNLNAEEKVILLMSASVARHSYAYWTMVWRDVNDPWWNEAGGYKENKDPYPVWRADVIGAVGCFFGGGFNPISAIGGYLGTSIAELAFQVWEAYR